MSAIFILTTKTTQPHPQVFSVNSSIIYNFAALLTSSVQYGTICPNFGGQLQLFMTNNIIYVWDFSQSEMEKYFE